MELEFWLPLLAVGAFVGFIAGLLGMGGGAVLIPALVFVFGVRHLSPEHVMHQAIATSLACILLGSITSLREHHAHGAVNWRIVRELSPGIVAGGLIGPLVVSHLPTHVLKIFFLIFLVYVSTSLLVNTKPKAARDLPGAVGMSMAGLIMGLLSALVGIGGAAISVPFMTWCSVRMHDAIGTSAALGFPIALAGTVGYIITGIGVPGLPAWSLGFVYLPALMGISVVSMAVAPVGARAAHRLPVPTLRRAFAVFLYLVTARMALSLIR